MANSFTSILAGFVIFSAVGYMSHIHNLPVDNIATDGESLKTSIRLVALFYLEDFKKKRDHHSSRLETDPRLVLRADVCFPCPWNMSLLSMENKGIFQDVHIWMQFPKVAPD